MMKKKKINENNYIYPTITELYFYSLANLYYSYINRG